MRVLLDTNILVDVLGVARAEGCRHAARRGLTLAAIAALACLTAHGARAAEAVSIAAAADLVFCLDELDVQFHKSHPEAELKVSSGSSGNFFTQIKNGAPFDVFLSADINYPRDLAAQGLADGSTLMPYAVGRIVLWTTRPEAVDVTRGLEILRAPEAIKRLAIANPEHAPYGRAAKAALESAGLWRAVEGRLAIGENIAQTAQFVQTGNADAGIVALSLVLSPALATVGRWQEIPAALYPKLEQAAVLTTRGAANPAARAYLAYLGSPGARAVFDRYGFRLPEAGK